MANSHSSTRRSSFSTFVAHQPRVKATTTKPGQCTHITMARLYTTDFQCMICLRNGSFGWLYRCTQDREILIENDIELGREEKLDDISNIFPRSNEPKKRSGSARQDRLSLLDEMSEEQFHSYNPTKLGILLKQRSDVLDSLSESCVDTQDHDEFFPVTSMDDKPALTHKSRFLPSRECQFKCCPSCRPTMRERSYLSLNGILNGDLPATVTTGFGFHLQKQRPFGSVKHVSILGLRPSPPSHSISTEDTILQQRDRQLFLHSQSFGLGISNAEREPESGRPAPSAHPPSDDTPRTSDRSDITNSSNPENEPTSYEKPLLRNIKTESIKPTPRPLPIPPTSSSAEPASKTTPAYLYTHNHGLEDDVHPALEPRTPLEKAEKETSAFSKLPLVVPSGVTVTVEAVENHISSVITQV